MTETTEQATERIAKRMARDAGMPALWSMFVYNAYREYHGLVSREHEVRSISPETSQD